MRDLKLPTSLFGVGIYTIPEASRISGISESRVRRWILGYNFRRGDVIRSSPPVVKSKPSTTEDRIALTFRDLIEVLCIHGFLRAGVRWPILRDAHNRATDLLRVEHPFATQTFLTDGHSVLMKIGRRALLDVVRNQLAFAQIMRPFLKTDGIDFRSGFAEKWWPLGRPKLVVLDSARSFGQPIVATEGVATATLYGGYLAETHKKVSDGKLVQPEAPKIAELDEEVVKSVSDWLQVERRSVRAAVKYETRLAA